MWEVVGGACHDVRHLENPYDPECWDGEKQLCISQVVEGLATNSG